MSVFRPFDLYRDIFRESIQKDKELLKYVFEKSDNISLWIIGLSVGGISIFANNIADVKNAIDDKWLRPILWLLASSVTSGVIYRSLYLYFFTILNYTQRGLEIAFMDKKIMDTESKLNGKESFGELLEIVQEGFGDDFSSLKNLYDSIDESQKQLLYNSVVDHYLQSIEFAKKDIIISIDFIADTYSKFTGIAKEKYIKKFNKQSKGTHYKWTFRLTTFFYLLYISTFLAALFLFACTV